MAGVTTRQRHITLIRRHKWQLHLQQRFCVTDKLAYSPEAVG